MTKARAGKAASQKKTGQRSRAGGKKGMKKQYLKTRPACRVTFSLPREAAPFAKYVSVVGDFNNWSITETPLKQLKNGDFRTTITLPCDREYRFRYLIDADRWENDWYADKYVPNCYGSDDSVVVVCQKSGK